MKKDLIALITALTLYWTGVIILVVHALNATLRQITLDFSQVTILGLVFCVAGFAGLIILLLKKDKQNKNNEEKDKDNRK